MNGVGRVRGGVNPENNDLAPTLHTQEPGLGWAGQNICTEYFLQFNQPGALKLFRGCPYIT